MLPEGYSFHAPAVEDAAAVTRLIAACQQADEGRAEITEEELRDDWSGIDLAEEAVIVRGPGGEIVAQADILNRSFVNVSVYGHVHPAHRGRGIGAALVDWGERWARDRIGRAPAGAQVVVQHYVIASNEGARSLLAGAGYAPVRGVYVMTIELEEAPPPPDWPAGIAVRTMVIGQDERAAHETHEDAFRDHWGRPPSTFERFLTWTRQSGFDPTLCFLAEAEGGMAGVLFSKVTSGKGWVEVVGVRRPWRRSGLALALLRHAFAEQYRRGVREIGLSVDAESLTGAPRVYSRAGMHVAQSYVIYRKELRPGVDLSLQAAD